MRNSSCNRAPHTGGISSLHCGSHTPHTALQGNQELKTGVSFLTPCLGWSDRGRFASLAMAYLIDHTWTIQLCMLTIWLLWWRRADREGKSWLRPLLGGKTGEWHTAKELHQLMRKHDYCKNSENIHLHFQCLCTCELHACPLTSFLHSKEVTSASPVIMHHTPVP